MTKQAENGARDVEKHLHDVGPDDGRHSALEGVNQRKTDDQDDGGDLSGPEHDGNDNGDRKYPDAFGERPKDEESTRPSVF